MPFPQAITFAADSAPVALSISARQKVTVLLGELLTPDRIKIPLVSQSKADLLVELVHVLQEARVVSDPTEVLHAVREREQVLSTGIGNGVAIPHGKARGIGGLVLAAGVTAEPVDFEALDGQPVRLFFLLVGPDSAAGQHVKALSRISRLLRRNSFRERLIGARSAQEFHKILEDAEQS